MMNTLTTRQLKARREAGGGIAPNIIEIVRKAMREHPEIDTKNDDTRGQIVDVIANEANGAGKNSPWGRKSRGKPGDDMMPVNPNGDGLAYLRPDGKFEIIDIIIGDTGGATWDHAGVFAQGENGYWARAIGSPDGDVSVEPVETHTYVGGGNDTGTCDVPGCGKRRTDKVHLVDAGKVRHKPWTGEDGQGDCDLCMKPVRDPIHAVVFEPPIPIPGTDAAGVVRDPKAYFFYQIGRREGEQITSADLKAIGDSLISRGMQQNVRPGVKPSKAMPFKGIAIMTDAGGARGRLFLPAAVPQIDENGNAWFTRDVQFIEDWAAGQPGGVGPFRLSWREFGPNPYVPVEVIEGGGTEPGNGGTDPGNGDGEPTDPGLTSRVVVLEGTVKALGDRLTAVEGSGGSLDPAAIRDAVAAALKGLTVTADVQPAGPTFNVLGRNFNLNHDHGITVVVSLDGREIARQVVAPRTLATADVDAHDTALDEAVRDSADAEGEA